MDGSEEPEGEDQVAHDQVHKTIQALLNKQRMLLTSREILARRQERVSMEMEEHQLVTDDAISASMDEMEAYICTVKGEMTMERFRCEKEQLILREKIVMLQYKNRIRAAAQQNAQVLEVLTGQEHSDMVGTLEWVYQRHT